jgi:hypothetical protein
LLRKIPPVCIKPVRLGFFGKRFWPDKQVSLSLQRRPYHNIAFFDAGLFIQPSTNRLGKQSAVVISIPLDGVGSTQTKIFATAGS